MNKIFILGSSGFIGSNLYSYLSNCTNTPVYRVGRKNCDIVCELSINHAQLLNAAQEGDVVIFLASVSSPDICAKQPELAYDINVKATIKLINELTSNGVKVIFSSTDVVFGKHPHRVTDDSSLAPFGYYGEMKADVEKEILDNNLAKVIRFSYVMGAGDKYTEMLYQTTNARKELEVFEGFERNVVSLSDVLEGIYHLINKWEQVDAPAINFGGPETVSRWELTKSFAQAYCPQLSYRLVPAPDDFWKARPKRIEMTSSLFSALLERQPKSIEDNIKEWKNK